MQQFRKRAQRAISKHRKSEEEHIGANILMQTSEHIDADIETY